MKIRVYILNWNGGEDLKNCIASLKSNKYKKLSITVIDNCSSDNSPSNLPDDISVIPLGENYGFSNGYNIGIKKSIKNEDEYIILLNYDTIVNSDFIDSIIENIKKQNSQKYIYGVKILYHSNQNIIWYAGGEVKLNKGIIRHVGIRAKKEKYINNYDTDYITGCCMIMHKDIFLKLNGFDDRFFMYNEDVDFCLRANSLGIKSKFLSKPEILHKVSASLGGNYSLKKIFMKIKSAFQLYNKYYSFHIAIIFMIMYFIKTILMINKNNT
ncbi:MAG: hypothetical protein CMG25_01715 [Candidatus Marinimicrobia bacterium]|nr:hypothetical protein [Candidatus Neomarinimicrobiota bacterium]|tara:strand:+ start:7741 stop:8547 length:807 start_codon:yes stop_codon:yes gene_type:complete